MLTDCRPLDSFTTTACINRRDRQLLKRNSRQRSYMTYTSDLQLRAAGLRPLGDIPNRPGVKIVLRTRKGGDVPCATVRGDDGCHYCGYDARAYRWSDFIGWRPA